MEEKKVKNTTTPGIPEAIHPHIGNGVAWEQGKHAFLLRNPDTSKQLEWRLLPEASGSEADAQNHPIEKIDPLSVPSLTASVTAESREDESIAQEREMVKANAASAAGDMAAGTDQPESIKPKRKKKPVREEKTIQASEPIIEEPKRVKTQKAGKLIKKAAKTVKRQEAAKNPAEPGDELIREITLSPYTNWLKGLAGSEYVHPYDEDYALNQGGSPPSGGISETYAALLAAQGHKEQALEMYMRLMEKYPEKSSFFAAKIEALQQQ